MLGENEAEIVKLLKLGTNIREELARDSFVNNDTSSYRLELDSDILKLDTERAYLLQARA